VQLINARDHWFSIHNCLEYFFWFKSRLHFHANVGMIPLGGNTVFLRRDLIERVGGWDEACLTEDADIGIRLSTLGEPIRVVYRADWVTQEETPHTIAALIKQRTRWHQGFLQVLGKGDWKRLPGWPRKLLALITLGAPIMDAVLVTALPFVIAASFFVRLPVPVALLSWAPLYGVLFQVIATCVAAPLFAKEFGQRLPLLMLLRVPLTYLPYQWLLSVGAVRAVARQLKRQSNWEKTEHVGAHRIALPQVPVGVLADLQDAA
jgi:cellulose synthase/poly-beta-1,6-N-acetylglucosamine synthase-like glycosyltransferase